MGNLTELDILDLLADYQSELRKLNYKIEFVKEKINELEGQLKAEGRRQKAEVKSSVISSQSSAKKENVKSKKSQTPKLPNSQSPKSRKPYKLSIWDELIIEAIKKANRPLISQEIYDAIVKDIKKEGLFRDEGKTKAKINQCLIKLANRRDDLSKVPFQGRGFAYAVTAMRVN